MGSLCNARNFLLKNVIAKNTKVVRHKHKENHWSVQQKKKTASMKAMEYFDENYEEIFKHKQWTLFRDGLLGKQKYVALINNYSDSENSMKFLEQKGAMNVRSIFNAETEYLADEKQKFRRQKSLETVWKSASSNSETETKVVVNKRPDFSLKTSLSVAEIDSSRIIDSTSSSAILYEFVPTSRIKGREDFIEEPKLTDFYDPNAKENPIKVEKQIEIDFPRHLNIYCFEEYNQNEFPQPRKGSTSVLNYYLMDGGSILPVLALDLKPGHVFLDMCSAPGGKSLLALQTLYPIILHCNDCSMSRTNRIHNVMNQYLYDFKDNWLSGNKIEISCSDGRFIRDRDNYYDRILVDVPCTTDRKSVKEDDNNIFRADRVKERLQLPEVQSELLFNALKMVKPGGVVVYSTCTLSPLQNEAVVHMTVKRIWEETHIEAFVLDLSPALKQFRNIFTFSRNVETKYGHLVVPSKGQNYGPTYFCKIKRIK